MSFSVVIPAYRPDTLATAVRSVLRQTLPHWELLLVGQGQRDSSRAKAVRVVAETLGREQGQVHYLHLEQLGQNRAINFGIQQAKYSQIAILGDDCAAHPEWLAMLSDTFDRHPDAGLVGGTVRKPPPLKGGWAVCTDIAPENVVYDPRNGQEPYPGWGFLLCNLALRRNKLAQVGLFDEHLGPGTDFPAAGDTDYRLRLEASQIQMVTNPQVLVYHTHGYRYGLKAAVRVARNSALGNGALAAKLTMQGDSRGRAWLQTVWPGSWKRPFRLQDLPLALKQRLDFRAAYERCLSDYQIKNSLLQPVH